MSYVLPPGLGPPKLITSYVGNGANDNIISIGMRPNMIVIGDFTTANPNLAFSVGPTLQNKFYNDSFLWVLFIDDQHLIMMDSALHTVGAIIGYTPYPVRLSGGRLNLGNYTIGNYSSTNGPINQTGETFTLAAW